MGWGLAGVESKGWAREDEEEGRCGLFLRREVGWVGLLFGGEGR